MGNIGKDLQRHHTSKTELGRIVVFGATPYEEVRFPINATPSLDDGLLWEQYVHSVNDTYGYASFIAGAGGNARPDVKLISAKFSNGGWTFTHEAKGRGLDYSQLKGNRALATYVNELADGGDSTWVNRSGGLAATSTIIPDGVSSRRGQNGLDILTIQSATPDYFLGNLELPTMSYIQGKAANKERKAWYDYCTYGFDTSKPWPTPLPTSPELIRASAQNQLGYTFKDTSGAGINATPPKYQDPMGGVGYYTDDYTITVGEAMAPRPCNENHLMAALSSSRVLTEIMKNHVKANGRPIGEMFSLQIRADLDLERDVFYGDTSGTINSIIAEMASHGVWRAWWDSFSNFHFVPDYYGVGAGTPSLILSDGPSLIGDLEVNLGTDQVRVSRAAVKPHDFISFSDATADPLTTNINMALGAVYPGGAATNGNQVTFDNYWGRNTGEQARRLYNKANAKTTFRWSNFPYPTMAFQLPYRVVALAVADPKGNFAFSEKPFVVTDVEIQLQDRDRPDGGYYLCDSAGIEI